ncbi:MAG: DNA repair protein RadC [Desulfobaccales bacterium]
MKDPGEKNEKGAKSDKPHYYGHRQRLRNRFLQGGSRALQDYELLELLLTFAIPYSDVKPLAKQLIQHFGSFTRVLDATPEALMEVQGVRDYSATLIRLVKACAEYYLKEEVLERPRISSLSALVDYCRTAMGGLPDEQFRVIFLNSQNEIIAEEIVQEGTVNQTVVYPRKVLELALKHKASGLILVHNHPSGSLTPSAADLELTRSLVKASRSLNLTVHDHLIISRQGHLSLAEKNLL